jgi:hypothetical protein
MPSLMPRQPHNYGWGGSRDYCLPTIPCSVLCCACNKNGKCEVPSLIKINADGKCQTGMDFVELDKTIKKSKMIVDGD